MADIFFCAIGVVMMFGGAGFIYLTISLRPINAEFDAKKAQWQAESATKQAETAAIVERTEITKQRTAEIIQRTAEFKAAHGLAP